MKSDQAKGKAKEVAGKVTDNKRTDYAGKAEKHGGKARAKLADLNNEAKSTKK